MTGRKNRAQQVPPVVPYKALENFSKALYGTTEDTCSERFFRPVMLQRQLDYSVRRSRIHYEDILSICEIIVGQRDNPA